MSESEFRKALLSGEEPIDVNVLTMRVLRKDRRRIWVLGVLCVISWMSVVMLPWAFLMPAMAKAMQYQHEIARGAAHATSSTQAARPDVRQVEPAMQNVVMGTMYGFLSNVICMFVAALCTVLLIVLSRRATLRQVNARLAEISARLAAAGGNRV